MVPLDKADSRYKSLVAYMHEHIANSPYSALKSALIKKGWPKVWIEHAHTDLVDQIPHKSTKKVPVHSVIKPIKRLSRHVSMSPAKNILAVPTKYKSKLLSKLSLATKASKSKVSKNSSSADSKENLALSKKLLESEFKTHEYLQNLLSRKEHADHFYQKKHKTNYSSKDEPTPLDPPGSNKDFDVLKEAIKLAQQVISSRPTSQTVPVQVVPFASPSPTPAKGASPAPVTPSATIFPGGNSFDKSQLDQEFEMQKRQLDSEREMLKRDREDLISAQKRALEEQTKALNLKVESVNITTDGSTPAALSSAPKNNSPPSSNTAHLENKMDLLEEKLKNMDYSAGMESTKTFKNDIMPEEVELVFEPVGNRAQTGISGFDPIIQGGFRRLTSNMVAGGPGSGKTIFGMQYITNGIEEFNEHGVFITFEQSKSDLYKLFNEMGSDLAKYEKEKKLTILRMTPHQLSKMVESGGGSLRDVVDSIHASRIVIDSVSDYLMLYKGDMGKRRACIDMFDLFSKLKCTSLMVSEQEVSPLKHVSSVLEYQVDGVILLYNERVGDIRQRAVEIFKMRGTKHAGRIFPMKISDKGILILTDHPLNKQ